MERALANRVAVLDQGRLCQIGQAAQVYAFPSHPYTEVLLDAVLEPDPDIFPELAAEDVVELSRAAAGPPIPAPRPAPGWNHLRQRSAALIAAIIPLTAHSIASQQPTSSSQYAAIHGARLRGPVTP